VQELELAIIEGFEEFLPRDRLQLVIRLGEIEPQNAFPALVRGSLYARGPAISLLGPLRISA
jgi:hypothetical protein